jgi:transketolase
MRPCDANEVAAAYRTLLAQSRRPTAMVLTRQNVPTLDRTKYAPASELAKGAYILAEAEGGPPQVLLMSTGSEVHLCLTAQQQLAAVGIRARVISMPCFELFDEQDVVYRNKVLPPTITARVAVEAAARQSWDKYLGLQGRFVGMQSYGASAPYQALYPHFGITAEKVVEQARLAVG